MSRLERRKAGGVGLAVSVVAEVGEERRWWEGRQERQAHLVNLTECIIISDFFFCLFICLKMSLYHVSRSGFMLQALVSVPVS